MFQSIRCTKKVLEISEKAAKAINEAKAEGRRIISVGTTATRALESSVDENGKLIAQKKIQEFLYIQVTNLKQLML